MCSILWYSCLENAMGGGAWQATYSSWGCKEWNMTEPLHFIVHLHEFIFTSYAFGESLKPLSDLALQKSMTDCPFPAKGEGSVLAAVSISHPSSSKPQRWPSIRVTVPLNCIYCGEAGTHSRSKKNLRDKFFISVNLYISKSMLDMSTKYLLKLNDI